MKNLLLIIILVLFTQCKKDYTIQSIGCYTCYVYEISNTLTTLKDSFKIQNPTKEYLIRCNELIKYNDITYVTRCIKKDCITN